MSKLEEPITFLQAARDIGWKADRNGSYRPAARRLLRRCLIREQEIGRRFVQRDRAGNPNKVTIGALVRHLPECRPARVDSLAATVRPMLLEFDRRAQKLVEEKIAGEVTPELERIRHLIRKEIADLALELGKAVPGFRYSRSPRRTEPR